MALRAIDPRKRPPTLNRGVFHCPARTDQPADEKGAKGYLLQHPKSLSSHSITASKPLRRLTVSQNCHSSARPTLMDVKVSPAFPRIKVIVYESTIPFPLVGGPIMTDLIVQPDLWITRMLPEGIIEKWLVADGATVASDDPVVDLRIENQLRRLKSPSPGRLTIYARPNSIVEPGTVIGRVDAP
nr:hypothetical protein [Afipia felis]